MAKQDPEGKRIARQRAEAASEALEHLTLAAKRAEILDQPEIARRLDDLKRDLRRFQEAEVGRGGGHLEPRRKYKGRSQHLAVESGRGVVTLFLDESGQSSQNLDQPLFVLAGLAMDDDAAEQYVHAADELKVKFGLPPEISLHGPQIEKGVDEFAFDEDLGRQSDFRNAVAELVSRARFRVLGAIIRKDVLLRDLKAGETYGNLPRGLYEMALTFVAERFVDMLHSDQELRPCGRLVFESIGNLEDALHQRAFVNLLIHGSEFVSDGCFRGWLRPGCEFRTKRGSHPLELADLAARAMLIWMRNGRPDDHDFWRLWAPHIATRPEIERGRFGVKIFPDGDIREEVLAFRRRAQKLGSEA